MVNNAGYALPNSFEENSVEDEENCIRFLATSVISLTKLFIRDMIKNNNGKIMIVHLLPHLLLQQQFQVMYGPIKTFMNRFNDALNINYNSKVLLQLHCALDIRLLISIQLGGVQDEMDRVPPFLKKSASRIAEEGVDGMLKGKKL